MDVIEGEDGHATKELERLVEFLRDHVRPQVISLPNLMFIGLARTFGRELKVPVVCELTGEDIFLDAMKTEDRQRIREVIRSRTKEVTRFVATSSYYADAMAEYLAIPRSQIDVVYTGLSGEYLAAPPPSRNPDRPPTVGYLARICPEKGIGGSIDRCLRHFAENAGYGSGTFASRGICGTEKMRNGSLICRKRIDREEDYPTTLNT